MGISSKAKSILAWVTGTFIVILCIALYVTYSNLQKAELTIEAQKISLDSYEQSADKKDKSDKITENTGTDISNKKESRETERNQIIDEVNSEVDKIRKEYQAKEEEAKADKDRLAEVQKARADRISKVRLEASWKTFCRNSTDMAACLKNAKGEQQ